MIQRLRIRFKRGEEIKFISHLDIIRLWERALHRAQIPLAYTEGFSPHPRLSLAAPLAVGVTGESELMDVFIDRPVSPHWFSDSVKRQLPVGIEILGVYQLALTIPSLQSLVRYAEYQVEVETEKGLADIKAAITSLLAAEHLPWKHQRDTGWRSYDLRHLIDALWLIGEHDSSCTLGMRLRCDADGSGRPEQVVLALGFSQHPVSIHRTKLVLEAQR